MALFSGYQKNTAQNVYANMRPYLAQKDGAVHIVLINSFSQLANQVFKCDEKMVAFAAGIAIGAELAEKKESGEKAE